MGVGLFRYAETAADESPELSSRASQLYPNTRMTCFQTYPGVFKVLKAGARGSAAASLSRGYTLVSHGPMSHQYSLLPETFTFQPCVRPLAVYKSPNSYSRSPKILDLAFSDGERVPKEYGIALYQDTYSSGHLEFCLCSDYIYMWKDIDLVTMSGFAIHYLWRRRLSDNHIIPVARIVPALFKNPIDGKQLWTLELDQNHIAPHIAFLSAFTLKRLAPLPIFSRGLPPDPPHLVMNVSFDDDRIVFARDSKYFADWEDEEGVWRGVEQKNVCAVKVFLSSYLEKYEIPDTVLDKLEAEYRRNIDLIGSLYSHYHSQA